MRFTRVEVPDIGIFGALEKQGSMGGLSVVSFWGGCKQAGPEATRSSEVSHLASQLLIADLGRFGLVGLRGYKGPAG